VELLTFVKTFNAARPHWFRAIRGALSFLSLSEEGICSGVIEIDLSNDSRGCVEVYSLEKLSRPIAPFKPPAKPILELPFKLRAMLKASKPGPVIGTQVRPSSLE